MDKRNEDDLPTKHPTFLLVLYNHKIRSQLQIQGRVALNISDLDENVTAKDLADILKDTVNTGYTAAIRKMIKRLHALADNVPET